MEVVPILIIVCIGDAKNIKYVVFEQFLKFLAQCVAFVFRDDGSSQLSDEFWQLKNWSDTLQNKSWCGGRQFFFMAGKAAVRGKRTQQMYARFL